jgi:hypothetical protein
VQDKLLLAGSKVTAAVAVPGLAATEFQANLNARDRVCGLTPYMRLFAQSAEDGTMPLLECICREHLVQPAFYGPRDRNLLGWLLDDGIFGPPVAMQPEPLCVDVHSKKMLWLLSEKAVAPFVSNHHDALSC